MKVSQLIEELEKMDPQGFIFFEDTNGLLRDFVKVVEDSDGDTILKENA